MSVGQPEQGERGLPLSRGKKALYGYVAPLILGVVGFWVMELAVRGEGPSAGGRSMVLFLVFLPAGFVIAAALNLWVFFVPIRSRLRAFLLGVIVPAVGVLLAYDYQWQKWPFQP
jgi:hypothetical protein